MRQHLPVHLSPEAAIARLDQVYPDERSKVAEGLALIALIDMRRDFLAAGYSCMKSFCMGRLGMTEDTASKRLQAARTALRFPQIFELLAAGRLSVSAIVVLAPHLKPESADELLAGALGRSRGEILQMLAARAHRPAPMPSAVLFGIATNGEDAPGHPAFAGELQDSSSATVGLAPRKDAPVHPAPVRRGHLSANLIGECEVQLTLTAEERADLRRVQDLLSHTEWAHDPALVYAKAMQFYAEHLLNKKLGKTKGADPAECVGKGRHIPMPVRRAVWERDGGHCAFIGDKNHRCNETRWLDFDHITPLALGGESTEANVRILCRPHNQHEARRVLGEAHMSRAVESAQRERARAAAATSAEAAKAARVIARTEPLQERHDDIVAAMRTLGYNESIALGVAAQADAWPDATLEECVKRLLGALTQKVRHRGEQLARCTT